ncbi:MAG: hypothetical protein U0P30_10205 [Vicinamibacterales bacterium]
MLALLAVATQSMPVDAREAGMLARAVSGLSEPGALVIWGTMLAGLSAVVSRRKKS